MRLNQGKLMPAYHRLARIRRAGIHEPEVGGHLLLRAGHAWVVDVVGGDEKHIPRGGADDRQILFHAHDDLNAGFGAGKCLV